MEWMNGWMDVRVWTFLHSFKCGEFVVFHPGIVGGQERPFYSILEAESVLCTAWIGQASGSSIYPEAEGTLLPATGALWPDSIKSLYCLRKRCFLLQGKILAPLPWGVCSWKCTLELSYLTRIGIALLHNFPAEALRKEWVGTDTARY